MNKNMIIKILVLVSFVAMVAVNYLAVLLPINNQTPGQVSDSYANLFAPAGITFSIWGVIYLLLGLSTLYQLGLFQKDKSQEKTDLISKLGIYFLVTSVANISWVFAWHYNIIPLSLVLIVTILIFLLKIADLFKDKDFSNREKFFLKLPYSVYLGWITVATIANVTVFLVSIGWDGFGISNVVWTILVLIAGLLIAIFKSCKYKDIAYGLVIIWAYSGILIKHISEAGYAGMYPSIIYTVIGCIAVLIVNEIYLLVKTSNKNDEVEKV